MRTFNRNFNEKLHECHLFNTFFFYLFNRSVRYTTYVASLHKQYFGVHLSNLSDLKACVLIIVTSVLHFLLKAPTGLCVHLSHRYRPDSRHGVQSVSVEIRDFLARTQWPDTHKAYAFHVPPVGWPLQTPMRWAHAVLRSVEFADDVRRTLTIWHPDTLRPYTICYSVVAHPRLLNGWHGGQGDMVKINIFGQFKSRKICGHEKPLSCSFTQPQERDVGHDFALLHHEIRHGHRFVVVLCLLGEWAYLRIIRELQFALKQQQE